MSVKCQKRVKMFRLINFSFSFSTGQRKASYPHRADAETTIVLKQKARKDELILKMADVRSALKQVVSFKKSRTEVDLTLEHLTRETNSFFIIDSSFDYFFRK